MGHWLKRGSLALVVFALVLAGCSTAESERPEQESTTTTQASTSASVVETTTTTEPEQTRPTQVNRRSLRTTTTLGDDTAGSETTTTTTVAAGTGTTTTTVAVTPTTVPGDGVGVTGTIGVVGCSNTDDSVEGYRDLSSLDLLVAGPLGGGSLNNWGNPERSDYVIYWDFYEERRPADGYEGVWVQVCIKASQLTDPTLTEGNIDNVTHVIGQIQSRDPGVPIWISPINSFVGICSATGEHGVELATNVANWAAANLSGVALGPFLGPLAQNQTRDGCHPNNAGKAIVGEQLMAFFDGT